jgi:hypothetical protein
VDYALRNHHHLPQRYLMFVFASLKNLASSFGLFHNSPSNAKKYFTGVDDDEQTSSTQKREVEICHLES